MHVAQTITPGQAVRAQLAKMCNSPREAFDMMTGREFFVEAKYDGAHSRDPAPDSGLYTLAGMLMLGHVQTSCWVPLAR